MNRAAWICCLVGLLLGVACGGEGTNRGQDAAPAGGSGGGGGAGGSAGAGGTGTGGVVPATGGSGAASGAAGSTPGGMGGSAGTGGDAGVGGEGGAIQCLSDVPPDRCSGCTGFPPGQCSMCVRLRCCTECVAFNTNPEALAIFDCMQQCADQACIEDCYVQHPDGRDDFEAFWGVGGCLDRTCAVNCDGAGCGVTFNDPECNQCLWSDCCDEARACAVTANCLPWSECVFFCAGDAVCEQDCDIQFPGGRQPYEAIDECLNNCCEADCAVEENCGLTFTDFNCDACSKENCCDEGFACANDAECVPFLNCFFTCTDQACEDACASTYPNGKVLADAMIDCVRGYCATAS